MELPNVVEAKVLQAAPVWLDAITEDQVSGRKRKPEESSSTEVQGAMDASLKEAWQKIRECSTNVAELISNAIHSGSLQLDVLSKIQLASEELFKMTKVVAPETELSLPSDTETKTKKKKDSDDLSKKKRRKRAIANPTNLYCHACGTKDTPEWRRGPDGCKSLCNACGLHYAKIVKKEQETSPATPESRSISVSMLLN